MLRYQYTFHLRDVVEPQVVWSAEWDDVEDLEKYLTFRGFVDQEGTAFAFFSFEPGSVVCVTQREYPDADNVPMKNLPDDA